MLNDLIKLADSLDRKGLHAEANLVDRVLAKIAQATDKTNTTHADSVLTGMPAPALPASAALAGIALGEGIGSEGAIGYEDDTSEENPPKKVSL